MSNGVVVAVDLGATSGRVLAGSVGPGKLEVAEVYRFSNQPVALPDGLHWDAKGLLAETLIGLRAAARLDRVVSVGVDSWGVDYGLLDAEGSLVGQPYHYRDGRTSDARARVEKIVSAAELYARTGIQYLPFNTVYQLAATSASDLAAARRVLLMPDLIGYWLTGATVAEITNASTTSLIDARTQSWATDLLERLAIPPSLFPDLRRPGDDLGALRQEVVAETGLRDVRLVAVASHDTASAVVGVPGAGDRFAFISSGTWSLVGVENGAPILTEASRAANFTNEIGVDGTVRYLRNVMGLWLLDECIREWARQGRPDERASLLLAAAAAPAGGPLIDPDRAELLPPGDMPARIRAACRETGQPVPDSRVELVRCILDSLADAYARAVEDAAALTGRGIDVIHVVGGGASNTLLCQLTADACGRRVVAGPVEATAIGNVLVQARARGLLSGDLDTMRAMVRATQTLRHYEPRLAAARSAGGTS